MAVNYERKQVTGTEANIKKYAGHLGQLAFAHDTKKLHVLSGVAGQTTELVNSTDLAGKANLEHTHTVENVEGLQTTLDLIPGLVPKYGDRGDMRGFATSVSGNVVRAYTSDLQTTNVNVEVPTGNANQAWTKAVMMTGGTINLKEKWYWANGEVPELKYPCILVCSWNNDKGIAAVINGVA